MLFSSATFLSLEHAMSVTSSESHISSNRCLYLCVYTLVTFVLVSPFGMNKLIHNGNLVVTLEKKAGTVQPLETRVGQIDG